MELKKLQLCISNVMPILNVNLEAAAQEYKRGEIAAGAFHYVRTRHENALHTVSNNDLNPESAYKSCALLAIDLESGMDESIAICPNAKKLIEAWWQCYRDAGFTAVHDFFETPMLPLETGARKQK